MVDSSSKSKQHGAHSIIDPYWKKKKGDLFCFLSFWYVRIYLSRKKEFLDLRKKEKTNMFFSTDVSLPPSYHNYYPLLLCIICLLPPSPLAANHPLRPLSHGYGNYPFLFFLSPFQIDPSLDWLQVFDADIIIDPDLSPPTFSRRPRIES